MATWKLSPQYKKSAVEKTFFVKDDKMIAMEQGFRWGTFTVQSDERPLTDSELVNKHGYELGCIDNDECWEMCDMSDGCWMDLEISNDATTSTDLEEFQAAWDADWYSGVEELGWNQYECEYFYHGPLELTNEDTGEVFLGEPDEPTVVHQTNTDNPIDFPQMPAVPVTDWYPNDVKPAYKGQYEVDFGQTGAWPFPRIARAVWTGRTWKDTDGNKVKIQTWRGLAFDPNINYD